VDIGDQASLLDGTVREKGFGGTEAQRLEARDLQQQPQGVANARVVIDDENNVIDHLASIWTHKLGNENRASMDRAQYG